MNPQTLVGRVGRVIHQDEAGHFTVFELETEGGGRVVVVGDAGNLAPGLDVRVTGVFRDHPRHGRRFRATTVLVLPPERAQAIAAYLASGRVKGIGKELARRIVAHFGEGTREALDGPPERLREVPGIGPSRAWAVHAAWTEERVRRETWLLLCGFGLTASQAARTIKVYGEEAPARVKADPYDLARRVPGVGFRTADGIARSLGIPADSPIRMQAAVEYVLDEAAALGHVFLPADAVVERVASVTGQDRSLARDAIVSLEARRMVAVETSDSGDVVFAAALHRAETGAAARLRVLAAAPVRPLALPAGTTGGVTLAASQASALASLLQSGVGVLTGGPGTGKTTVIGAIIEVAHRGGLRVALAAPTGRAAMRMREATRQDAKTVHRLLEFNPRTGEFQRGELFPLDADWVVVDEASMMDIVLLDRLLRAIAPGTRLTLVGDADQLPPVGPGDPFRDVIASGAVPVARLTEVFRQGAGSAIVHAAHRVLAGLAPVPAAAAPGELADFYVMHCNKAEKAAEAVLAVVADRIPARFGLDPATEVQVIAPMHKGACGTDALNEALRARLNPTATPGMRLAPGDRVIQQRNNYDREVFNGDIGTVVSLAPGGGVLVRFEDREVLYDAVDAEDLTLAYAITVHKSQGSEFPAVVIVLHSQHYVMLRRNLLYTALTRGRRLAVLVGDPAAIRMAVTNARVEARNTRLAERLKAAPA